MSGLLLMGVGVASAGIGVLLIDVMWWFQVMLLAAPMLLVSAVVRRVARSVWWPPLASAAAGVVLMTVMFAPGSALLGVVPTWDTVGAFAALGDAGWESIAQQHTPAEAVDGVRYLICLGVGAAVLAMDAAVFVMRSPVLAGLPLLVLLLVPSSVRSDTHNPLVFALTAVLFLAMLLVQSRRFGLRVATGLGVLSLVVALTAPMLLPDVGGRSVPGGGGVASINPILALGNDLRRDDPTLALVYETTSMRGQYLRLAVLDDFTGASWEPSLREQVLSTGLEAIGAPPGLSDDVTVESVTTGITVSRGITSRWLPAPYAPVSVTGVEGRWRWESDSLGIRTDTADARGQEYLVESIEAVPTVQQLLAARSGRALVDTRYLDVPDELPELVRTTAQSVAGTFATPYERAVALQAYFVGGDFEYSEVAPVQQGYDGSGAEVLGRFLEARSGYCVHFSSAMAAMARTLGIPARVAVGFAPGEEFDDDGTIRYRVSTHEMHAWPELYFDDIGWMRFEPTPGRGFAPEFPDAAVDDPATPDVDESAATPTPTPTPTAPPPIPRDELELQDDLGQAGDAVADTGIGWNPAWLALGLLVLLVPAVVRLGRRAGRMRLVRRGSAHHAWAELLDTALDLRMTDGSVLTPRAFAAVLQPNLGARGDAALARLLAALESEAYAGTTAAPRVADVRTVLWGLRRHAGLGALLAAWLVPRTVVARRQFSPG